MHKCKSFRTSKFPPKVSGLKFFLSPQTHYDPKSGKTKMKFENLFPGNPETLLAASFKANFMTIHA